MVLRQKAEEDGVALGEFLRRRMGLSSTLIKQLKRRPGALLVNGQAAFTSALLRRGDVVAADLRDPPNPQPIPPTPMALDIPYEDQWLLVVNKGAPLPVHHSSFAPEEATLAGALAAYLGPGLTFHPVNRLDRGTTGLMVVAKCSHVHHLLTVQLHTGRFFREYRGVALGRVDPPAGTIRLPIARDPASPIKRRVAPDGAPAVTDYETLAFSGGYTLLRLLPRTGRTHQLRLHLAAIGHPLAGDWLYGTEDPALIPRPALHSALLSLRHPITGALLELSAPLPADMARLVGGAPSPAPP